MSKFLLLCCWIGSSCIQMNCARADALSSCCVCSDRSSMSCLCPQALEQWSQSSPQRRSWNHRGEPWRRTLRLSQSLVSAVRDDWSKTAQTAAASFARRPKHLAAQMRCLFASVAHRPRRHAAEPASRLLLIRLSQSCPAARTCSHVALVALRPSRAWLLRLCAAEASRQCICAARCFGLRVREAAAVCAVLLHCSRRAEARCWTSVMYVSMVRHYFSCDSKQRLVSAVGNHGAISTHKKPLPKPKNKKRRRKQWQWRKKGSECFKQDCQKNGQRLIFFEESWWEDWWEAEELNLCFMCLNLYMMMFCLDKQMWSAALSQVNGICDSCFFGMILFVIIISVFQRRHFSST